MSTPAEIISKDDTAKAEELDFDAADEKAFEQSLKDKGLWVEPADAAKD